MKASVLCVDDEPEVLASLSLQLGRHFSVIAANGPRDGLKRLAEQSFEAVISDMRMPDIDGAEFLHMCRLKQPDAARILLTGYSDAEAAARAVNHGQVFRYLTKPCAPSQLLETVSEAVRKSQSKRVERDVLEETLHTCVLVMMDLMGSVSPETYARTQRLREFISDLADELVLGQKWQFVLSAMLSQLGAMTVGRELAARAYAGQPMNAAAIQVWERLPELTAQLVGRIPRLEAIAEIVRRQGELSGAWPALPLEVESDEVTLGARLLALANTVAELEAKGLKVPDILERLAEKRLPARVLEAVETTLKRQRKAATSVHELTVKEFAVGDLLDENLVSTEDVTICRVGTVVSEALLVRLLNFSASGRLREPVRVQRIQ